MSNVTRREFLAGAAAAGMLHGAVRWPNILFLMVDEMRWDAMGCEKHPVVETANLDRLARDGVRFAASYTVSPVCSPARASVFTGRYAHVHGVTMNGVPAHDGEIFLPSILKHYGYHTAIAGKLHYTPVRFDYGFDQFWSFSAEGPTPELGYSAYLRKKFGSPAKWPIVPGTCPWPDDPLGRDVGLFKHPREDFETEWITDRSIEYLRSRQGQGQPWLLFTSFLKPHSPSVEPQPWFGKYDPKDMPIPKLPANAREVRAAQRDRARRHYVDDERMIRVMSALYYGAISHVDQQIGRLLGELERLGMADNTLILFTADHGNMLGDARRAGQPGAPPATLAGRSTGADACATLEEMRSALALFVAALAAFGACDELHRAVRAGNLERVRALLEAGCPVNHRDGLGSTPLHDAAWSGEQEIAALLIERGAEVNAKHAEGGSTPLHYAVITNQRDLVELLLENGADLEARYRSGSTALHLAANRGYLEIVELLLRRGASLEAEDDTGGRPLDEAAWKGQTDVARLLLAKGADGRRRNRQTGVTPLHEAALKGHRDVVALLLEAGADVHQKDNTGSTALDEALRYRHSQVVEVLLKKGASLKGSEAGTVRRLQEAVLRGQLDVVRMLLESGVSPNVRGPGGSTPLHDAALKGHKEIAELLLDRGAAVNARNSSGGTPLHDACLGGHRGVAELLLSREADLQARDESGITPLHVAASWGRIEVLELLLARGADPSARNRRGLTPLAQAEENGQQAAAALLRALPRR